MRLENLSKLLDGEIVNSPSISHIEQLKTDPNSIQREDVYVSTDSSKIDIAIKNGAYCIVFDENVEIIDNEIAWIRVDDIKKALVRYLRYKVIQTLPKIYLLDDVAFEIIKKICRDERAVFLDENIIENFSKILKSKNDSILICNNKEFFGKINPSPTKENFHTNNYIKVIKYSLLRMDFIYDDTIYKEKIFPYIFIDNLNKALSFSKKMKLNISLDADIYPNGHFEPFFIDKLLSLKKFGETSKVILIEQNIDYLNKEIEFLKSSARYAKNLLCLSKNLEQSYDIKSTKYSNFEDLIDIFKDRYNFYLLECKDAKKFKSFLKNFTSNRQRSLF